MNIEDVKQIPIADYLHSLGYSPVKQPVSYTHLFQFFFGELCLEFFADGIESIHAFVLVLVSGSGNGISLVVALSLIHISK